MNGHDCPGLYLCGAHPRWHVSRARVPLPDPWWADEPGDLLLLGSPRFTTHAEAVAYATEQARAQQVTAVQDGAR